MLMIGNFFFDDMFNILLITRIQDCMFSQQLKSRVVSATKNEQLRRNWTQLHHFIFTGRSSEGTNILCTAHK